jgi:hypothetical protein
MPGIPRGVIIFLCVLAAGFVVLVGYATLRHYQGGEPRSSAYDVALMENGQSQDEYMRDVRLRNREDMARRHGFWLRRQ